MDDESISQQAVSFFGASIEVTMNTSVTLELNKHAFYALNLRNAVEAIATRPGDKFNESRNRGFKEYKVLSMLMYRNLVGIGWLA